MTTFFCLSLRHAGGWLVAGLLAGAALPARAQDSTLTRLIRQNHYPLVASGAQFSGAGWDKIRVSVQQSQFVLVGEDHGTAQIPQFTAAVAQVLHPALYVAEIDPYVAQTLISLAGQPGPPTAYLRQHPGALGFYTWAEEFELVRTLRAQQAQVVGLDQVFATTAGPFYARLASIAKGKGARDYLQQRAAAYQAHDLAIEHHDENFLKLALVAQSPAAIDSLRTMTRQEGPAVQKMVQAYATSYQIYQSQIKGTGGHQERLNLLKRNLLEAVRPYQTAGPDLPKMLFKFGAAHVARGLSFLTAGEYYDVGNLAQDLAEANDQRSLHILVLGKQGSKTTGFSADPAKSAAAYTAAADYKSLQLAAFFGQATGPGWSVIDLRPARRALTAGKLPAPGQAAERIIQGYDYLVIIPETTASRPM